MGAHAQAVLVCAVCFGETMRWLCLPAIVLALCAPGHAETALPVAPAPVERTAPEYPSDAYEKQISGEVLTALTINERGAVSDVRIMRETPADHGFGAAAVQALAQWRFPEGRAGRYRVAIKFAYQPPLPDDDAEARVPRAPPPISRGKLRYPFKALSAGAEGDVGLIVVLDAGRVADVRIGYETPPRYGFAEAATKYAREMVFPANATGQHQLLVRFRLEHEAKPTKTTRPDIAVVPGALDPAPAPVRSKPPVYPPDALKQKVAGVAVVGIKIDENGRVTHAGVLEETPQTYGFGLAAVRSVADWRFPDDVPGAYHVVVEFDPASID